MEIKTTLVCMCTQECQSEKCVNFDVENEDRFDVCQHLLIQTKFDNMD